MNIRPLNRDSKEEINLVADRMRKTLEDVMGEEKGANFYSQDWLLERVEWHISLQDKAEIFLVTDDDKKILAQAIVRIEIDPEIYEKEFGYFSTIYVVPEERRKGIARDLINTVHNWCVEKNLDVTTYSTAKNHGGLISLFKQFGYEIVVETDDMVRLKVSLK